MKNILIISIYLALLAVAGCRKRDTDHVSQVVKVSKPTINLKGDKFVTLAVGGTYTDPGATLIDDITGSSSDIVAKSSNLDLTKPGLYYMLYSAKNSNGYFNNNVRYIAVTNYNDAVDISGTYKRTANAVVVNVTKVSKAMYKNDDMGGAKIADALYFAIINDTTIASSPQFSESLGAEIKTNSGKISLSTPYTFQYALSASGYGPAVRVFVKQ
ncbi:MAG: immunoglobulin-like domain-containing protein [Taibaiella sp.]|jgi:uncharacterized lipoprotein NlpE involved in copper resistance